jgi:cytochrome c oxidase subunit 2
MRHLRVPRRWYQPLGLLGALCLVILAGCHGPYPQSTLEPRGDFSQMVDSVFMKTVVLATIVFILVEGALLVAVFKFRGKPGDAEPKQIHGSTVVEIVWTIIPAVVLAIVAVPTVQTIFATAKIPTVSADGQPPLKVEVIGHQWFWEFRYPELHITTANELHVPLNRTVDLRMKSIDVIHAFWVPQFAGKRDIFPNRETRMWFTAQVTGAFPGACAEFCGTEHGRMDFYLMVDSADAFQAWVDRRLADSTLNPWGLPKPAATPPAAVPATAKAVAGAKPVPPAKTVAATTPDTGTAVDPKVAEGEKLFTSKGCMGCHSFNSFKPIAPQVGPNLSGIGSRTMIAAGWLPNTEANLKRWLMHFDEVKPGVAMRLPVPLKEAEADALLAYLRTHK